MRNEKTEDKEISRSSRKEGKMQEIRGKMSKDKISEQI